MVEVDSNAPLAMSCEKALSIAEGGRSRAENRLLFSGEVDDAHVVWIGERKRASALLDGCENKGAWDSCRSLMGEDAFARFVSEHGIRSPSESIYRIEEGSATRCTDTQYEAGLAKLLGKMEESRYRSDGLRIYNPESVLGVLASGPANAEQSLFLQMARNDLTGVLAKNVHEPTFSPQEVSFVRVLGFDGIYRLATRDHLKLLDALVDANPWAYSELFGTPAATPATHRLIKGIHGSSVFGGRLDEHMGGRYPTQGAELGLGTLMLRLKDGKPAIWDGKGQPEGKNLVFTIDPRNPEHRQMVLDYCKENEISEISLHLTWLSMLADGEMRYPSPLKDMELMKAGIDFAKEADAKVVVLHLTEVVAPGSAEARAYRDLIAHAQVKGILVGIEQAFINDRGSNWHLFRAESAEGAAKEFETRSVQLDEPAQAAVRKLTPGEHIQIKDESGNNYSLFWEEGGLNVSQFYGKGQEMKYFNESRCHMPEEYTNSLRAIYRELSPEQAAHIGLTFDTNHTAAGLWDASKANNPRGRPRGPEDVVATFYRLMDMEFELANGQKVKPLLAEVHLTNLTRADLETSALNTRDPHEADGDIPLWKIITAAAEQSQKQKRPVRFITEVKGTGGSLPLQVLHEATLPLLRQEVSRAFGEDVATAAAVIDAIGSATKNYGYEGRYLLYEEYVSGKSVLNNLLNDFKADTQTVEKRLETLTNSLRNVEVASPYITYTMRNAEAKPHSVQAEIQKILNENRELRDAVLMMHGKVAVPFEEPYAAAVGN